MRCEYDEGMAMEGCSHCLMNSLGGTKENHEIHCEDNWFPTET